MIAKPSNIRRKLYCSLLLLFFLWTTGILSLLRFAISYQALEQYVSDVRVGRIKIDKKHKCDHGKYVGVLSVACTDVLADKTVIVITNGFMFSSWGFAHSLSEKPTAPEDGSLHFKHFIGHWWYVDHESL